MNRPGFMGGLFAGLLGAGLIGLLLGGGLTGGLGGLASFLGLALQIGIVVLIGWLLFRWWQSRQQPATAMGPSMRDMPDQRPSHISLRRNRRRPRWRTWWRPGLNPGSYGAANARPSNPDEIGTTPADFDAFERLLGDVQTAYGAEDIGKLRNLVTPELLSYYLEDFNANASRGVINRLTDIKLLQGDPAEAWREGDTEYCTVAVRYSLKDEIVDRASGRVVVGRPRRGGRDLDLHARARRQLDRLRGSADRLTRERFKNDAMAGMKIPAISCVPSMIDSLEVRVLYPA